MCERFLAQTSRSLTTRLTLLQILCSRSVTVNVVSGASPIFLTPSALPETGILGRPSDDFTLCTSRTFSVSLTSLLTPSSSLAPQSVLYRLSGLDEMRTWWQDGCSALQSDCRLTFSASRISVRCALPGRVLWRHL